MWKIIITIQKAESMLIELKRRSMLGTFFIIISPSVDSISKERIKKIHIALPARITNGEPVLEVNLAHIKMRITM